MAIKVKKGGVYTDPVGIFVKKAGVYSAASGVFAKVAGAYVGVSSFLAQIQAIYAKYPTAPGGSYTAGINDGYNFQDSAGTTPVTALEQVCGLAKDQSGRVGGINFIQPTSTARVKISARQNLLLATDTLATQSVTVKATPHTLTFTGSGTVTLSGASTAGPLVGGGSLTFTPTAGSLTLTVTGSVTFAQLEMALAFTRYQKVNTATDYDATGWPIRYVPDGVDDFFVSAANVDCRGTDKMFVCAGYRAFRGTFGTILTSSGYPASGTFSVTSGEVVPGGFTAAKSNGAPGYVYESTHPTPRSVVASAGLDLGNSTASASVAARVNGVALTGTYGGGGGAAVVGANALIYLLMQEGMSNPFQGGVSTINFLGANITAAERAVFEAYANSKEQAY